MDIVYIKNLEFDIIIGIYDWEKQQPQLISLDLEMATNCYEIAKQDDITQALDYATISQQLAEFLKQNQFELIETLAENIANFILNTFPVTWLRLDLRKPNALANAQTVGVRLERCSEK